MKKSFFLLAVLAAVRAFPAPMYYTFTGKINFIPQDQGGYAASHDIKVGNTVTYVFAVDTALPGFTKAKGVKTDNTDLNQGTGHVQNYFLDSLIGQSLFSAAIADSSSGSYFGYQTITTLGATPRYTEAFQTIIGDQNRQVQVIINITDTSATDFLPKVGATVSAGETYVDSSAASASASLSMTLTAISATKPTIGIRAPRAAAHAWMQAELRGNALLLENESGREAEVKILNASGQTALSLSLKGKAAIPVSALPHGLFFLRVDAAAGETVLRTLVR